MSLVWFESNNFMNLSTGLWIPKGRNPHSRNTQLSHWHPLNPLELYYLGPSTESFAGLELCRLMILLYPKLMLHGGECCTQERWCLQLGRGAQLRCHDGCHSALFLEPHTSVSPQMTLACSALPPPAPGWMPANEIWGIGPLRGWPSFLQTQISLWHTDTSLILQPVIMWDFFLGLVLCAREPNMLLRSCSSRQLMQLRYPSFWNLSCCLLEGVAALSLSLPFLSVSTCRLL